MIFLIKLASSEEQEQNIHIHLDDLVDPSKKPGDNPEVAVHVDGKEIASSKKETMVPNTSTGKGQKKPLPKTGQNNRAMPGQNRRITDNIIPKFNGAQGGLGAQGDYGAEAGTGSGCRTCVMKHCSNCASQCNGNPRLCCSCLKDTDCTPCSVCECDLETNGIGRNSSEDSDSDESEGRGGSEEETSEEDSSGETTTRRRGDSSGETTTRRGGDSSGETTTRRGGDSSGDDFNYSGETTTTTTTTTSQPTCDYGSHEGAHGDYGAQGHFGLQRNYGARGNFRAQVIYGAHGDYEAEANTGLGCRTCVKKHCSKCGSQCDGNPRLCCSCLKDTDCTPCSICKCDVDGGGGGVGDHVSGCTEWTKWG